MAMERELLKFLIGETPVLPIFRLIQTPVELAALSTQYIAKPLIERGMISSPAYYSEEIRRYEESALRSSRII
jgi:hypothetical protein